MHKIFNVETLGYFHPRIPLHTFHEISLLFLPVSVFQAKDKQLWIGQ
jgi:hypothetical protein